MRRLLFLLIVIFQLAAPASSVEVAKKGERPLMSLDEAVSLALSHIRNVINGRLEVEKAEQQVSAGGK